MVTESAECAGTKGKSKTTHSNQRPQPEFNNVVLPIPFVADFNFLAHLTLQFTNEGSEADETDRGAIHRYNSVANPDAGFIGGATGHNVGYVVSAQVLPAGNNGHTRAVKAKASFPVAAFGFEIDLVPDIINDNVESLENSIADDPFPIVEEGHACSVQWLEIGHYAVKLTPSEADGPGAADAPFQASTEAITDVSGDGQGREVRGCGGGIPESMDEQGQTRSGIQE